MKAPFGIVKTQDHDAKKKIASFLFERFAFSWKFSQKALLYGMKPLVAGKDAFDYGKSPNVAAPRWMFRTKG